MAWSARLAKVSGVYWNTENDLAARKAVGSEEIDSTLAGLAKSRIYLV
jgi:hypothetical protein